MKNLAIKAVGTGPGFYYREEHEWQQMTPTDEAVTYLVDSLKTLGEFVKSIANKGGDMTIHLTAVGDGQAWPEILVSGVTRKDLVRFQEDAHKVQGKMLTYGKKTANKKK